jgi:hypothetical protein
MRCSEAKMKITEVEPILLRGTAAYGAGPLF